MNEDSGWRLEPIKRFAPTVVGFTLGCAVFFAKVVNAQHGVSWLLLHALCGPFEKPIYSESGLTHTDIFFGALLSFIALSHVFSMRRQTVFLTLIGAFIWVAAAIGHYG